MEELINHIRQVIDRNFPGAELELEESVPNLKVGGFVIWSGFEGQEHIDRQRRIWNTVRKELSRDEQDQITALLTITPEEMAVAREG